jgi:hypothetical protein
MTYLVTKFKGWFGKSKSTSNDPVYRFFFETSSGERKKVYRTALKKAQEEQEKTTRLARTKR